MGRRFLFFVSSSNQCRITAPVARKLQELGHDCEFFNRRPSGLEDPAAALAPLGHECGDLAQAAARLSASDVLITCNAGGPPAFQALIARGLEIGCSYVGIVDGCRAADRFGGVPLVLGWGPSAISRYPQKVEIVGSPAIEACWSDAPPTAQPRYAVINYKFTYGRKKGEYSSPEARLRWLEAAEAACVASGLATRVSGHPATAAEAAVEFSRVPFSRLIQGAALLVSPVSTVLFQAIAGGVPVVLLPAGDESLGEFEDPMGAFEVVRNLDALGAAVARAVDCAATFRDHAQPFFRTHVSIEPGRPALDRMVAALLAAGRH